jgi:hypothetical protein
VLAANISKTSTLHIYLSYFKKYMRLNSLTQQKRENSKNSSIFLSPNGIESRCSLIFNQFVNKSQERSCCLCVMWLPAETYHIHHGPIWRSTNSIFLISYIFTRACVCEKKNAAATLCSPRGVCVITQINKINAQPVLCWRSSPQRCVILAGLLYVFSPKILAAHTSEAKPFCVRKLIFYEI